MSLILFLSLSLMSEFSSIDRAAYIFLLLILLIRISISHVDSQCVLPSKVGLPSFLSFPFSFPHSPTLFSSNPFSIIFLLKFSDLSCTPLWRIVVFCIPEDSNSLCMSAGQQHRPLPLTCVAYAN